MDFVLNRDRLRAVSAPRKKPLITANMVTVVRLLPMPLLSWLLYLDGLTPLWIALVLGTIIGCTDFVDGYLARKHGPTVFGGMLDPIADKVFIAFCYLPFADHGLIPWWAVALMFVREFLVTALRSAYEQRGMSMKTSYLGKVKTWVQMQGIGMFVLFPLLGHRPLMTYLLWFGVIAPIVAMAALWLIRRKFWVGAIVMSASFLLLALLHAHGDMRLTMNVIMIVVVAMTWLSGIDYVWVSVRDLRGRSDFGRADGVRVIGAIALPILVLASLVEANAPAWAMIAVLSVELAVGGLDNLLSHHQSATGAVPWGTRILGACVLLAATLVLAGRVDQAVITGLAALAAAFSITGGAYEFWRGSDYYLDSRIRDKALSAASTQSA